MPSDDEIRELCARALTAQGKEFEVAISDLQSAIRYRLEDLSNQVIATLLKMPRVSHTDERETKVKTAAANSSDNEELDQVS